MGLTTVTLSQALTGPLSTSGGTTRAIAPEVFHWFSLQKEDNNVDLADNPPCSPVSRASDVYAFGIALHEVRRSFNSYRHLRMVIYLVRSFPDVVHSEQNTMVLLLCVFPGRNDRFARILISPLGMPYGI